MTSGNSSFNFRVVVCRIRLFPTLISKIKWLEYWTTLNSIGFWLLKGPNFHPKKDFSYSRPLKKSIFSRNRATFKYLLIFRVISSEKSTWFSHRYLRFINNAVYKEYNKIINSLSTALLVNLVSKRF